MLFRTVQTGRGEAPQGRQCKNTQYAQNTIHEHQGGEDGAIQVLSIHTDLKRYTTGQPGGREKCLLQHYVLLSSFLINVLDYAEVGLLSQSPTGQTSAALCCLFFFSFFFFNKVLLLKKKEKVLLLLLLLFFYSQRDSKFSQNSCSGILRCTVHWKHKHCEVQARFHISRMFISVVLSVLYEEFKLSGQNQQ